MKRLTLLLLIFAMYLKLNAQADTVRIYELNQQNTYDSSLIVFVDKSSLDSARYMKVGLLSPRIKDLSLESSPSDKDLIYFKILTDGSSYTESKATMRSLIPDIDDITTKPVALVSSDFIGINSGGTDYKITGSSFMSGAVTFSQFTSAVDGRFGNTTFDSEVNALFGNTSFNDAVEYFNGHDPSFDADVVIIIDATVTSSYMETDVQEEIPGDELIIGLTTYGELYMTKIGDNVTGVVRVLGSGTGTTTYTLDTDWQPMATVRFTNLGGLDNTIVFKKTGQVDIDFDEGIGDGANSIGVAWSTLGN